MSWSKALLQFSCTSAHIWPQIQRGAGRSVLCWWEMHSCCCTGEKRQRQIFISTRKSTRGRTFRDCFSICQNSLLLCWFVNFVWVISAWDGAVQGTGPWRSTFWELWSWLSIQILSISVNWETEVCSCLTSWLPPLVKLLWTASTGNNADKQCK